eukprot:456844-Pyramimonas_sp.AAC.1
MEAAEVKWAESDFASKLRALSTAQAMHALHAVVSHYPRCYKIMGGVLDFKVKLDKASADNQDSIGDEEARGFLLGLETWSKDAGSELSDLLSADNGFAMSK